MKTLFRISFFFIFGFLIVSQTLFSQSQEFKPNIKFYPSLTTMYGLFSYKTQTGDKNGTGQKHYNLNYCLGLNVNADLFVREDFAIQFYAGYNRWNFADLFPVGVMIKPQINKKTNELYVKIGGGHSFGKRYYDINEHLTRLVTPNDYGKGKTHLLGGLEKNWHISQTQSFSVALMISIQFIKSYHEPFSYYPLTSADKPSEYTIPYKFAGLIFSYHFY